MNHYYRKILLAIALLFTAARPGVAEGRDGIQQGGFKPVPPLCFIENKGQITDQHYQKRNDIDFVLHAGGLNIFIGKGAIHYQWAKDIAASYKRGSKAINAAALREEPAEVEMYRMDVVLPGINKNATFTTEQADAYYETYYTAPIGLSGAVAHSYKRITYKNIYPAIDWVLYISNNSLKYDFVVHPGGDIKKIQLEYSGAMELSIVHGALKAITPFGVIIEDKPNSYLKETKQHVTSEFRLTGNAVSFNVDKIFAHTLVIDPALAWATYFGGSEMDQGFDITTSGNDIVMVGNTFSTSNIATTGAYKTALSSIPFVDAFIAKFNGSGNLLWATYYGGNYDDIADAVTNDLSGNIYLSGYTGSSSGIVTPGAQQTSFGGDKDNFLAKFNASGGLIWATYYGGSGLEQHAYVACDNWGNVYMSGVTASTTGIATSGCYRPLRAGGNDTYLAKFNSSGARLWGTYYGGAFGDLPSAICCDLSSGIIVVGATSSDTGIATTGSHGPLYSSSGDGYVAKFDSAGLLVWGTYYGGTGGDAILGLVCDSSNNIYIGGRTSSTASITTPGSFQPLIGGGPNDAFLSKFNAAGVLLWGTYYGGTSSDEILDIALSDKNIIYVVGSTNSTTGIATPKAYKSTIGGINDLIFVSFDTSGVRLYGTYYGSLFHDVGTSIAAGINSVYFSGVTDSYTDIATSGSHQINLGGDDDAFLVKITLDTMVEIKRPYYDTFFCTGDTFFLHYSVSEKFYSGNSFSAELSDPAGNFISPTTIGILNSDTDGIIRCILPVGLAAGNNYRVRISASSPARTSADNAKNIRIGIIPSDITVVGNSPVCTGNLLSLTASSSISGVIYKWSGPSGFISTMQNLTRSPVLTSYAGDYIVTAEVNGCISRDTISIAVNISPAPLTASANGPVCYYDTIKLQASTNFAGVSYTWTGPNNYASTSQSPLIINPSISASGDYVATATLNGCVIRDTVAVTVLSAPFSVTASSNSPVCDKNNFILNAVSSATGVNYSWTGPFGFTATGSSYTLSNIGGVNGGDYIVTADHNGCLEKDTVTLVVNPLPVKPIAASNTPICTTDTLRLLSATLTTGVDYSWTGPNGFSSTTQNPSVNNPSTLAAGDYVVTATITATGCIAKDTETIAITQSPSVTATNSSPVCEGASVNLGAIATPATAVYSWSGPGSFSSSSQNPVISNAATTASGDYIVSATSNGCTGKDTTTVLVKPNPIAPVTNSNTPVCVGATLNLTAASNAGSNYSWTGPGSFSSAQQNPSRSNMTAGDAGIYSVIATLNGCVSPAGSTTVVVNPQPFVTIYATPADSICQGSSVTFVALPANTSSSVAYKWTKNSNPSVLGTSNTFISTAINNNDIIRCEITETLKCGVPFTDTSNEIKMTVLSWVTPSVSITANPSAPLSPNQLISFTATPVNGGSKPQYQWTRNGSNVIGANAAGWSTQQLSNNDVICVSLTSSEKCPQPKMVQSNCITVTVLTGVNDIDKKTSLQLYPNPNDGRFTVKATGITAESVSLEIINDLGQLVKKEEAITVNNELMSIIDLNGIANGVYLLKLLDGDKVQTLRFTVSR